MIVDARGLACPQPIMETKKILDTLTVATAMEVYIDDDIAMCNVEAYLSELGIKCDSRKEEGVHIISFTSKGDGVANSRDGESEENSVPISCIIEPKANKGYIVVIKSLSMGDGSRELGEMLMKGFVNTLGEAAELPSHIILYNEGVKLVEQGSSFIPSLQLLESKGTKIIACGACVDYYDIKHKIALGTISNMYKIVELTTASLKVVYP